MNDKPAFTPYITVSNGAAAIDFYKSAFGAEELTRHLIPESDKIMHAHLLVHGGNLMLSDDCTSFMGGKSETPEALGGSPVTFHLHVEDADSVFNQAVAAGAQVKMPLANMFWGDRYGQVRDPFGFYWSIGQTLKTPTPEEIEEGSKAVLVK